MTVNRILDAKVDRQYVYGKGVETKYINQEHNLIEQTKLKIVVIVYPFS